MHDASLKRHGLLPVSLVLLSWVAIAWFSHYRYQPVPVVPASAPPDVFSAERAEVFFQRLYKNATPHPAGANADFRDRIVEQFRALGYEVRQQECSSMDPNWRYEGELPVPLTNIVAWEPRSMTGGPAQRAILACHFDSHPESPGAADDGHAVAILLEIARMMREGHGPGPLACEFLLTDGEEFGLLGAREHVRGWQSQPNKTIINVEARGSSGPSLMFETSDDSRWLVDIFSRSARRPLASSLFYEIYKVLPNDTDFTVFREAGLSGMNFAFIGDVRHYHTPDDNFQNLDRRSLQHQGENVWNVLCNLPQPDSMRLETGQSVYFDLFGYFIVRWPADWTRWLLVAGLASGFVALAPRFGRTSPPDAPCRSGGRPFLYAAALLLVSLVACAGIGMLVNFGLGLDGAFDNPFPDFPLWIEMTFWLWPLCAVIGMALLLSGKTTCYHVCVSVISVWGLAAIAATLQVIGASYLFLVPLLLVAGFALLVRIVTGWKDPRTTIFVVACFAAVSFGLIWLPMERIFYDAVGFRLNLVVVARVATVVTVLLPILVATRRKSLLPVLLVATSAAVATTLAAVLLH